MTEFRPSRFEILPLIIKNLLIINVLFFLAQQAFEAKGSISLEDLFGLHHVRSPLFQPWQIITHMFLHGSLGHLFANMFALWMFGSVLENMWGPKRFITFYFLCGLGAALIQLASLWYQFHDVLSLFLTIKNQPTPDTVSLFFHQYGLVDSEKGASLLNAYLSEPSNVQISNQVVAYISDITYTAISNPTIGASGAVFGILAAFVYLFPNTHIYLYFLVPIKAKWIGLGYFGYEIFSAIQNSPGNNIAHWAHVGGGIVGFLLVITWNKTNRKQFH